MKTIDESLKKTHPKLQLILKEVCCNTLLMPGPVLAMLRCLPSPQSPAPADKWSLTGWRVAHSMNTLINNDTKTNIQLVTSHYSAPAPATTHCNVNKGPHQSEM